MPTTTIVCLANSYKHSGRCVAGIQLPAGSPLQWIRPVSARPGHEVSEEERQYRHGADPAVGDIIEIPLVRPQPDGFQSENWLLDPDYYWEKTGEADWEDLLELVQDDAPLWINGDSTWNGMNDRVPEGAVAALSDSLRLVLVQEVVIRVYAGYAKREVSAQFECGGEQYELKVTDPDYKTTYLAMADGNYPLGECILTVSLAEVWNGYAHKVVAAIFEKDES